MNNFLDKFSGIFNELFSSQDSKFFIKTAFKIAFVPIVSFSVIFYSLWNILEMNYSFFVANGFAEGSDFKEAFIDKVLMNVSDYFFYFGAVMVGIFLAGLLVSHLALRAFEKIEQFCYDSYDNPDQEYDMGKMNQKKLINISAKLFFTYMSMIRNGEDTKQLAIPNSLTKLKKPKTDFIFLFQYFSVIAIICLVTSMTFYTFTNELYEQIVTSGLELLSGNQVIAKFMRSQQEVLFNIYFVAIALNTTLYIAISTNIIKAVDGVSYAFTRDLLQVIQGNHSKRIFPRFSDPGKNAAEALNEYIELVFEEEEDSDELDIEVEDQISPPQRIQVKAPVFPQEEHNVLEIQEHQSQKNTELPPAFLEEKKVVGGESVFNITTPKGYKVENLPEEKVIRLLKELELKD